MSNIGGFDFYFTSFLHDNIEKIEHSIIQEKKDVKLYIEAAQRAFSFLENSKETGEKHTGALKDAQSKWEKLIAIESSLFDQAIQPAESQETLVLPSLHPKPKPEVESSAIKPKKNEGEQKLGASTKRDLWLKASEYEKRAFAYLDSITEVNQKTFYMAVKYIEKAAFLYAQAGDWEKVYLLRSFAASNIKFPENHSLYHLNQNYAFRNEKMIDRRFGAYFSNMGSTALKGGCLHVIKRKVLYQGAKKECFCIDFKLTVPTCENLHRTIDAIEKDPKLFIKSLPADFAKDFKITKGEFVFKNLTNDYYSEKRGFNTGAKTVIFDFGSKGTLTVCRDSFWDCLYNCITLEIPSAKEGQNLKDLFQMLSILGLGEVAVVQSPKDIKRMQIGILYRTFFPERATPLERNFMFYELNPEKLCQHIVKESPEMEAIFQRYFVDHPELLQREYIYPDRAVWSVKGISDKMREKGALGLTIGVISNSYEGACHKLIPMLLTGSLSSQDRFHAGIFVQSLSSTEDMLYGGGDQVFTRLLTKDFLNINFALLPFSPKIQILCNLDAVNRGSYAYQLDCYGGQAGMYSDTYATRENLIDFTEHLEDSDTTNEVMIKNRLGLKHMFRVVVSTQEEKEILIKTLSEAGLIEKKSDNKLYIHGRLVDNFIYVSKKINAEMWDDRG